MGNQYKNHPSYWKYPVVPAPPNSFAVRGHFHPETFEDITKARKKFHELLSTGKYSNVNFGRIIRVRLYKAVGNVNESDVVLFIMLGPLDGEGLPSHFEGKRIEYVDAPRSLQRFKREPQSEKKYNRPSTKQHVGKAVGNASRASLRGYSD